MTVTNRPHAILIAGKLYGYGRTLAAAWADFSSQICGGPSALRHHLRMRAVAETLSDDKASEVEEMLAAPVLAWEA